MKRPEVKIRFDSYPQKEAILRAAKRRKWSFNRFVVEAAHQAAKFVATQKVSEQLIVDSSRQPLNQ